MELGTLIVVGLVIIVALIFDFTNGFHDTANAMATSIATGALKPRTAVLAAGTLNLIGAFLSVEVAKTISGGLINEDAVTIAPEFILAGLIGAILWNLLTWLVGLPSSSSHALFGGLVGAVIVGAGAAGVNFGAVLTKILLPSILAVIVAGLASFTATKIITAITKRMNQDKVESGFRHGQTVTACLVALSHGTNDAQKTMGIITLTLVAVGAQAPDTNPQMWVVAVCGLAIALGTYMGGWRVIRTLGKGLTEINTPQGFAAEASSATVILTSSHLGFALSTTQVCSGSIIGTGLGTKGNEVNWGVAGRMVIAWLVTFPAAGLIGAFTCLFTKFGTAGTVFIVLAALVAGFVIFRLSRRNPVNAMNVNDRSDVKLNADSDTTAQAA
ncbi:phosphate transporter [Slackia equolifaciens]|uniref:Phosphate transporter n=1 Tax=Slackia equolifaciens TaxID=498718 RepID=A0A3N0AUV0_9ACTN|nr:inorganic phosphate transporter [Slackia equolifaciens]RNL38428.1 phosphate transporter [Slackia equolifaciens]HJF66189.1 inorganic phosphate transporter [Slackia equolifaciens]